MHTTEPATAPATVRRPTTLILRPLRAGEDGPVRDVFAAMSDRSRRLRFHTPTPVLTAAMVRHLTAVRPGHHEVVVALAGGRAVGIARWIRVGPEVAELAMEVADDHHGAGVGRALCRRAARAAWDAGIRTFQTYIHPENTVMREWTDRLGATAGSEDPDERRLLVADFLASPSAAARAAVPVVSPAAAKPVIGGHAAGADAEQAA